MEEQPRLAKELLPHLKHKDKIIETFHACAAAHKEVLKFYKSRISNQDAYRNFIAEVTFLYDLIEEMLIEENEYKEVVTLMQSYQDDCTGMQLTYKQANKVYRALKLVIYKKKLTDLGIAADDWEQDTIDM